MVKKMIVSLIFTGDFAPCRGFEPVAISKGAAIFGDLEAGITAADVAFVNLEVPFCLGGMGIAKSGPNLRAHPDCVRALAEAKFDVIGLANNHLMDFGSDGLKETMQVCQKAGLTICGSGTDLAEAQRPIIINKKKVKIAFIAVAEHESSIAETKKTWCRSTGPH